MKHILFSFGLLLASERAHSASNPGSHVMFSIVKTAIGEAPEGMMMQGGSFFKKFRLNHSAFLIGHGKDYILVDTGLGKNIDHQFKEDMPFFLKPMLKYTEYSPVVAQVPADILTRINRVFLTHTHWDHVSGVEDFKGSCVAMANEEMDELSNVWPSQRLNPKWCRFEWKAISYKGFERSYDVFDDGSVVIVPLPGHTKGSIGIFLKTPGKTYFLIGDLAWSRRALMAGKRRSVLARWLVDGDSDKNKETLDFVRKLAETEAHLVILPSHDSEVQEGLGYFPNWIKN